MSEGYHCNTIDWALLTEDSAHLCRLKTLHILAALLTKYGEISSQNMCSYVTMRISKGES